MKNLVKSLFVVAGFLFVGLGTIGIMLPVLPTTPFYLLAVFCFARGSERFLHWFQGTKLYQRHISEFVATGSMTLRQKLTICIPVAIIVFASLFMIGNLHVTIAVTALMLVKWWYFAFRIKTTPRISEVAESEVTPLLDAEVV
jgi:uncharacterized membrane protein YbaN (DUF454 family)